MTRRIHAVLGILSLALAACSGQSGANRHAGSAAAAPPMLLEGLGRHHQAVTTNSREAQAYFDQGLRLVYAFNHIEAARAFREATRLDPACAMCYWGIALTHGSNYNSPTDAEREKAAYAAIQEALRLADRVTPRERATIEALAKRHSTAPGAERAALDRAYANAMREVTRRFPDDLDAATLFADALMNLRPAVEPLEAGRQHAAGDSGDPGDPRARAPREPGASGRAPPLHPRRRSWSEPGAG